MDSSGQHVDEAQKEVRHRHRHTDTHTHTHSTYSMIPLTQSSKEAKSTCDVGSRDDGYCFGATVGPLWACKYSVGLALVSRV